MVVPKFCGADGSIQSTQTGRRKPDIPTPNSTSTSWDMCSEVQLSMTKWKENPTEGILQDGVTEL